MTIIVIHSGILRRRDLRVSDVLMDGQLLTDASQDLIDRTSTDGVLTCRESLHFGERLPHRLLLSTYHDLL